MAHTELSHSLNRNSFALSAANFQHTRVLANSSMLEDRGSQPVTSSHIRTVQSIESGVFGVCEGASGIYHPHFGPQMRDTRTYPQDLNVIIEKALRTSSKDEPLMNQLIKTNQMIYIYLQERNLPIDSANPSILPSLKGSFFKIENDLRGAPTSIDIATWGDAMAIVEFKDGSYWLSENKALSFNTSLTQLFNQIKNAKIEKFGDWNKAAEFETWDEILPAYSLLQNQRVNNLRHSEGYLLLNGEAGFERHLNIKKFAIAELKTAIFFTSGMMLESESANPSQMAGRFLKNFHFGGLKAILSSTRQIMQEAGGSTWGNIPEVAAMEVRF